MVNSEFISLCSKAWAIQILAYFHSGKDPRISPITHHFTASRTSITAAIQHLVQLKYLRKNSGHGHPLRPAYALSDKGKAVAEWAAELDKSMIVSDWAIARRTWSLPILREAIPTSRYGEIRAELNPVTDRALSETLKMLGDNHWLDRIVDIEQSPPSVAYAPSGTGKVLTPILIDSLTI